MSKRKTQNTTLENTMTFSDAKKKINMKLENYMMRLYKVYRSREGILFPFVERNIGNEFKGAKKYQ